MALVRRAPDTPAREPADIADWLFADPWRQAQGWPWRAEVPSIDLRETDDAYVVEAELPGLKPDDAEVTFEGRTLVIRGRYGDHREEAHGGRWIVRERRSGSFARAIAVPGDVDRDAITADFENGELTVTLPKTRQSRARRIPVGGAEAARPVGAGEGRPAVPGAPGGSPMPGEGRGGPPTEAGATEEGGR